MVSSVDGMSAMDAVTATIFGIGLPSWDVYSDIFFAYTLMKVECRDKDGGDVYTHKIINDETECDFDYHGHTKFGIMKVECRNKVAGEVYRYGRIMRLNVKNLEKMLIIMVTPTLESWPCLQYYFHSCSLYHIGGSWKKTGKNV